MENNKCQIRCFPEMAEPLGTVDVLWQRRKRLKRILKRRWRYLMNHLSEIIKSKNPISVVTATKDSTSILQPGDMVTVKSKEEIQKTLNQWNMLKGCAFMEEMWPYCGTAQKVLKRVEKFLDERDYLIKKCRGIVILDSVFCEGAKDFGACDRTCFFFWREEWLEKIE